MYGVGAHPHFANGVAEAENGGPGGRGGLCTEICLTLKSESRLLGICTQWADLWGPVMQARRTRKGHLSVPSAINSQQRGESEGDRKAEIVENVTAEPIEMITERKYHYTGYRRKH